MAILQELRGANLSNSHDPLNFSNVPTQASTFGCTGIQNGGYKYGKKRSPKKGKKTARGLKRKHGKYSRTHRRKHSRKHSRKYRRKHSRVHSKSRRRRRTLKGGALASLSPGELGQPISISTSQNLNNVANSQGYSLAGDVNTNYGSLASPPPHQVYQKCPF